MATAGELKTLVTADTTQFSAGLTRATQQARAFGGGMVMQMQAASAGLQDFAAVLGQGGSNSIGRAFMAASNNISQFTATMGPWGAAIGGVAAILASTLIPKLLATANGVKDLSDELKEAGSAWDAFFAQAGKLQGVQRDVSKINDPEGLRNVIDDADFTAGQLRARLDPEQRNLRQLVDELNRQGLIVDRRMGGFEPGVPIPFGAMLDKNGQLDTERFGITGPDATKTFMDQARRVRELQLQLDVQNARGNLARERLPEVDRMADQALRQEEVRKQSDEAKAMLGRWTEAVKTPFDRAADSLNEIGWMGMNIPGLTDGQFDAFSQKVVQDFARSQPKDRDTAAMTRDSMAAARTILSASRPQADDPQVQKLQQIIDHHKENLRTMRAIERNTREAPEPVDF